MQRNLDKDDIRDASDLLTHIDGWEKTGAYDEKAIEVLDRWHAKRERIHREAEALYTQIYATYETYVDSYEEQHHSMAPERIAADLMNHNMSDSHIGTIGRALEDVEVEGTNLAVMQQAVMIPAFEQRLWNVLHDVNSLLLEEDQFFGYFYLQMAHRIRFDMTSAFGINLKQGGYVLYVNPFILLRQPPDVMKDGIKREILHIISAHLMRVKSLSQSFNKTAVHMAMDMVVNDYLEHVDRDAVTVANVNERFGLMLKRFRTIEYYAKAIDKAMKEKPELFVPVDNSDTAVAMEFDPQTSHDIWDESDSIDTDTMDQITERYINEASKGDMEGYVKSLIDTFQKTRRALPWYFYLKKLMGKVASGYKKTTMRRNRRQPERLELSGTLRQHKANVWVALDMSGSITDVEFTNALEQVLQIVHAYNHRITVVECDNEVRRTYTMDSVKDVKPRLDVRGATAFSPVFSLANQNRVDLLVYFTDGKGEERLRESPKGYKVLWVLTGENPQLSIHNPYGLVRELGYVGVDETQDIDEFVRMSSRSGFSMANQEV
ncbi:hypothetical protein VCHSUH04_10010 [Veillonella sp. T14073-2]|uniref:vWA domain-containing protein n=1 Tax=Veillonella sp. T14073-2 TaxID=1911680 RepID=UPI000CF3EF23|nr:hypothetical protein VCHSUH04_10010 [Veillonella sp. T14073-2]